MVINKKHDICLELGCGKGRFMENIADENPDKNFVAVDLKFFIFSLCKSKVLYIISKSFPSKYSIESKKKFS